MMDKTKLFDELNCMKNTLNISSDITVCVHAITNAKKVIMQLPSDVRQPEVFALKSGELYLFWEEGTNSLSVNISCQKEIIL